MTEQTVLVPYPLYKIIVEYVKSTSGQNANSEFEPSTIYCGNVRFLPVEEERP